MSTILIKIFAVALTLSQITTRSDVKTEFDPTRDRAEVVQLLHDGCAHMLKAFDLENINIDELIAIAMNDPKAVEGESKVFHGINFDDLFAAYRQFCKGESVGSSAVEVDDIIALEVALPRMTNVGPANLIGPNPGPLSVAPWPTRAQCATRSSMQGGGPTGSHDRYCSGSKSVE